MLRLRTAAHILLIVAAFAIIDLGNSHPSTDLKDTRHEHQTFTNSPDFRCDAQVPGIGTKHFWNLGSKWPGAVVKYVLHSSLTPEDTTEVYKAFDVYHQKTCIRFEPKTDSDPSWVSIENDPDTCGVAHICRNNGYQFAKFGGSCRTAGVMVHELGHSLCFLHEQDRPDRDNYLRFQNCEPPGKEENSNTLGMLYDYRSAMHYGCDSCMVPTMNGVDSSMCGGDFSALDAEKFNAFYECGGCFGFRFRPADRLTEQEQRDMFPLGVGIADQLLYLCRAYHNGDIIPGSFDNGICYIPWGGQEHVYSGAGVDVFIVPGSGGGQSIDSDSFRWQKVSTGTGIKAIPENAIPGGREKNGDTTYIGFCTLQRDGKDATVIGKIRLSEPDRAYVPFYGAEVSCTEYSILVCG